MSNVKDPIRLYDVRAQARHIKHGLITQEDVDKHLSTLPDVAAKGISLGEVEDARAAAQAAVSETVDPFGETVPVTDP